MTYQLVKPALSDRQQLTAAIAQWRADGSKIHPGLLRQLKDDYSQWLDLLDRWERGDGIGEAVPQTLFLLKDPENRILGAAALRPYLNKTNILDGGHLGYGIFPAYRGRGLGNVLLKLSLEKLRAMGVQRVLVTCDDQNLLSRKVIQRGGGILENIVLDEEGVPVRRYWIDNSGQ